jgi:hypothetical protein
MTTAASPDDPQLARRVTWLCRLLGVGGLALLAVTWRLWTPQDVFPRVPLFAWAPPRWWDWASFAMLVAGLLGLCLPARYRRISAATVAGGFAIQFLADQHRLQPWAWQFFILAVVIALADDRTAFRGWFLLAVMIYAWSALSKADDAFVADFAAILRRTMMTPIELIGLKWTLVGEFVLEKLTQLLAILPALVEIAIPGLALPVRTRRWAFRLSAVMHLYLITLLGPWGLGHQPGVLLWNLFFIGQNALLFGDCSLSFPFSLWTTVVDRPLTGSLARTRRWVTESFLTFVLLWPALEPWGYCDAWLGWAVYVPRFQQVDVRIHDDALNGPLSELNEFAEASGPWKTYMEPPLTSEMEVRRMSLKTLGVPAYPNHRFAVGVALDWQSRVDEAVVEAALFHRRDRFAAGFFHERTYATPAEIEAYARTFRVNALPESVLRRRAAERRR